MPISGVATNGSAMITECRYKSVSLALQESNTFFTDIQCQWWPVGALQFFLVHVWNLAGVVAIALDNLVQTALISKPNAIDLVSRMLIVAHSFHLYKLK